MKLEMKTETESVILTAYYQLISVLHLVMLSLPEANQCLSATTS